MRALIVVASLILSAAVLSLDSENQDCQIVIDGLEECPALSNGEAINIFQTHKEEPIDGTGCFLVMGAVFLVAQIVCIIPAGFIMSLLGCIPISSEIVNDPADPPSCANVSQALLSNITDWRSNATNTSDIFNFNNTNSTQDFVNVTSCTPGAENNHPLTFMEAHLCIAAITVMIFPATTLAIVAPLTCLVICWCNKVRIKHNNAYIDTMERHLATLKNNAPATRDTILKLTPLLLDGETDPQLLHKLDIEQLAYLKLYASPIYEQLMSSGKLSPKVRAFYQQVDQIHGCDNENIIALLNSQKWQGFFAKNPALFWWFVQNPPPDIVRAAGEKWKVWPPPVGGRKITLKSRFGKDLIVDEVSLHHVSEFFCVGISSDTIELPDIFPNAAPVLFHLCAGELPCHNSKNHFLNIDVHTVYNFLQMADYFYLVIITDACDRYLCEKGGVPIKVLKTFAAGNKVSADKDQFDAELKFSRHFNLIGLRDLLLKRLAESTRFLAKSMSPEDAIREAGLNDQETYVFEAILTETETEYIDDKKSRHSLISTDSGEK